MMSFDAFKVVLLAKRETAPVLPHTQTVVRRGDPSYKGMELETHFHGSNCVDCVTCSSAEIRESYLTLD